MKHGRGERPLPEVLESPAGVRAMRALLTAEVHAAIVGGNLRALLEPAFLEALHALPDLESP